MESRSIADLIVGVASDREHGASWLSQEALRIVGECATGSTAHDVVELARDVRACAADLIRARPGMAPVRHRMEWVLSELDRLTDANPSLVELRSAIAERAQSQAEEARQAAHRAARNAADVLATDSAVFTASLSQTVLSALRLASRAGKLRAILAAESRHPDGHRYGADLASALADDDIPAVVIPDAAIAERISDATVVWLGADSIFSDGSILNGTPSLALAEAAHRAGRPVAVIAESAKFDPWTAPENVATSPGFDRIPAHLVETIVTERGITKSMDVTGSPRGGPDSQAETLRSGDGRSASPPPRQTRTREDQAATLVARIAELLGERGETVAVAESAAGGRICDVLTDRPGSSAWFAGGLLAYSNASKQQVAGISPETLADYGAVSPETSEALAESARRLFGATWGIGETGIAGPQTGRRSTKPAGLAHIAVVGPNDLRQAIEVNTGFDARGDNKWAFAIAALTLLAEELEKHG